jgi:hypothetical protein
MSIIMFYSLLAIQWYGNMIYDTSSGVFLNGTLIEPGFKECSAVFNFNETFQDDNIKYDYLWTDTEMMGIFDKAEFIENTKILFLFNSHSDYLKKKLNNTQKKKLLSFNEDVNKKQKYTPKKINPKEIKDLDIAFYGTGVSWESEKLSDTNWDTEIITLFNKKIQLKDIDDYNKLFIGTGIGIGTGFGMGTGGYVSNDQN